MRNLLLIAGFILLFAAEILRFFFLLPFSASQRFNAIDISYFFYHNIWWLRISGLLLILYPAIFIFSKSKWWKRIVFISCFILFLAVAVYSGAWLNPSNKYQPLLTKKFAEKSGSTISFEKPVVGVFINGEAKAYPMRVIGYHHVVNDSAGNMPVIVTYCTICRSCRVYRSVVNGHATVFKLVGLSRYNAIFEDSITHSWWQQANGRAIAGPMKGHSLMEVASKQAILSSWVRQHPNTEILQPDNAYQQQYALLDFYDEGLFKSGAVQTDTATHKAKSLVLGVATKNAARSYDWNKLRYSKLVEDSLKGMPLLITVEDNNTFHVLDRDLNEETLQFEKVGLDEMKDLNTSSLWNMEGKCIEGELQGEQLKEVQSYQETRESWIDFHPSSEEYDIEGYLGR